VIPQDELDRLALVKCQAESISREGFPELGYSVLKQGHRRINKLAEPWSAAADAMWQEAIRDHCELFSITEAGSAH
jgi:hypothetical protein